MLTYSAFYMHTIQRLMNSLQTFWWLGEVTLALKIHYKISPNRQLDKLMST